MESSQHKDNNKPNTLFLLQAGSQQLFARKRLIFFWWIVNLLAAAVVIAPLAAGLASFLGHSAAGHVLPSTFDLHPLMEYAKSSTALQRTGIALLAMVFGLYALVSLFLIGGSVDLLQSKLLATKDDGSEETRSMLGLMLQKGLYYWPRLLRLLILSLVFYGLYFYAFGYLRRFLDGFVKGSIRETPVAYINWLKVSLLFFGLGCIKLFFDVVKIKMITEDNKSAFKATWGALNMCSIRISQVLWMLGLTALCSGVLGLVFRGLVSIPAEKTVGSVFLVFCIHQVYLWLRIALRLWYYASAIAWYEHLSPACPTPSETTHGASLDHDEYIDDEVYDWDNYEPTIEPKEAEAVSTSLEAQMKDTDS